MHWLKTVILFVHNSVGEYFKKGLGGHFWREVSHPSAISYQLRLQSSEDSSPLDIQWLRLMAADAGGSRGADNWSTRLGSPAG